MNRFLHFVAPFAIPGLILSIFLSFVINQNNLPSESRALAPYLSYISLIVALIFGWLFNRSQIFFTSILLLISQFLSKYFYYQEVPNLTTKLNLTTELIFLAVAFLLPLNILLLSFYKERGILTRWGKMRFAFIVSEIYLVALFITWQPKQLFLLLTTEIIKFSPFETPLTQLTLLAFCLATLFFLIQGYVKKSFIDISFVNCLIAIALALHFRNDLFAIHLMFSAAGLILSSAAIQNSYAMAYQDELTKLPARRALYEESMKLSNRYVIAMVDIDHFKSFNDTYGHDIGDNVLKMVATKLRRVGGGGKAYRYGGEEFLILFKNMELKEVLPYLESLRETVCKSSFALKGKKRPKKKSSKKQLSVTISIGVAEKKIAHKNYEEVIKTADKALYVAKNNGRNQVCH